MCVLGTRSENGSSQAACKLGRARKAPARVWGLLPRPHLAQATGSETGGVRQLPPTEGSAGDALTLGVL